VKDDQQPGAFKISGRYASARGARTWSLSWSPKDGLSTQPASLLTVLRAHGGSVLDAPQVGQLPFERDGQAVLSAVQYYADLGVLQVDRYEGDAKLPIPDATTAPGVSDDVGILDEVL